MPRTARKLSSTGLYHIILRGVNREAVFIDDEDRRQFLKILKYIEKVSGCEILCYCLMDNHIHILLKVNDEPLATIIKRICGSYVLYFNKRHGRIGHLFQERFRSEPVESNRYFLTVFRYILRNPVKAGMVKLVSEYRWSSYNEYVRASTLTGSYSLNLFAESGYNSFESFKEYVNTPNEDECLEYEDKPSISDDEVKEIIEGIIGVCAREIKKMDKCQRNATIKRIKAVVDVPLRQLARVTGLSKSLLSKI
ncbi:transposase [Dethiobacter alkaliphilus]|uniref:Transposase IS200-like domain-containing protein n=1 Tax=Dethiobacter alkaliphilus AHT 1 TaxID=555088 RepID=C0GFX9_DETAL|nr:transposase [Dethiobacter alkaliphilus]EEG77668.1 protein of unknown function DUF1568 [Dethiobacter alkaliphilus AHT 1]